VLWDALNAHAAVPNHCPKPGRRKYADDIDKGVWRQRERQTDTFGGLLLSIQQMIPAGFPETLLLP
jgi:hypothetical protein